MKKLAVLCLAVILSSTSCFAWGWRNKDTKKNTSQAEIEVEPNGNGYVGKLPDLTKGFKTSEPQNTKPVFETTKDFNSSEEIPALKIILMYKNLMLKHIFLPKLWNT